MLLLSVAKRMEKKTKVLMIKKGSGVSWPEGKKAEGNEASQKEMVGECRLELSMSDYGKLMKLAMREGCSIEELVARQIARLVK